jgi:hypothetical protein
MCLPKFGHFIGYGKKRKQSPGHICRETAIVFFRSPDVFDHTGKSQRVAYFP